VTAPAGRSRVAIVTGASSGIGEATARRLRELGWTVYAAARRVERMTGLAETGVVPLRVDVTSDADLVRLVDRVMSDTGRVDVLVNNAGYGSYGALEEVPLDEVRRQIEVNLVALARLVQLVLPTMRAQGSGRVINVSSMGGRFGEPLGSWYHATKFAVEGLSDSLRLELAPFGIDVVVVQPGSIATEWGDVAARHVLERSAGGPYAAQAARAAAMLRGTGSGSSPDRVAATIARAATARRPRTRYRVGLGARPVLAARKVLPDRVWDALLVTTYDRVAGAATRRGRPDEEATRPTPS
jgi:NAD(P)-dependent dehydrogenase (short-subunit alcohol dehydrogenase family)